MKNKYMEQYREFESDIKKHSHLPAEEYFEVIRTHFDCSDTIEQKAWFGSMRATSSLRFLLKYKDIVVEIVLAVGGLYIAPDFDCYDGEDFIRRMIIPALFLQKREW